jgi:peptide deformylase
MQPTTLKIRLYGDPCLKKKSSPVKEVGPGERMLIESMLQTMYAHKGIGLAAPQVGINQKIFVADIGEGPIVVVNPKITKKSGSHAMEEGCLSIPGVLTPIKRAKKITVKFIDENNQEVTKEFSDLLARVFQHENDHLEGRLILDYVKAKEKKRLLELFKKAVEEGTKP